VSCSTRPLDLSKIVMILPLRCAASKQYYCGTGGDGTSSRTSVQTGSAPSITLSSK
jgi:hypothetical protein